MIHNNFKLFQCNLCSAEITSDPEWFSVSNTKIMTHYHCVAQHYAYGSVQMQLFDLEKYLSV